MGEIVTDHRDLVHPWAEVRTQIRIDGHAVQAMVALVNMVFTDLQAASDAGVLKAYEQGATP
jgi:hypothetical protein